MVCVGNALELMDRHGWGFHERIMRTYGSVIKLHWLFGVCTLNTGSNVRGSTLTSALGPGPLHLRSSRFAVYRQRYLNL